MEFSPLTELLPPSHSEEGGQTISPETKRHIVLGVLSIVLFVITLVGVLRLVVALRPVEAMMSAGYYLNLGMVFVPLFAFAVVLVYEAKMGERLSLSSRYKGRLNRLERNMKYREDMLRFVSDHQPASLMIFDRHNRFFFVNENVSKSLDRPACEIIGMPPIKILPNEQAKRLEMRLTEVRSTEEPLVVVDCVVDNKGLTQFIQSHYQVISDNSELDGCVMLREEDLTSLIVEREHRERMLRQVIDTLVAVVDRRDPYAAGHSARVGQLSKAIAQELGLEKNLVEAAEIAGSLMNFGKVLVSRRVLTKTTPLTPEELQRVRDSILTSADILAIIGFETPVVPTLRQVLERYDGGGAPDGLKGDEIMLTARIVSASNAFVAFVSPRAHRGGLSFREALNAMAGESGKAFDEQVLVAMSHFIEKNGDDLDWLLVNRPVGLSV